MGAGTRGCGYSERCRGRQACGSDSGVVVSIVAFQAVDPGSIPGCRILLLQLSFEAAGRRSPFAVDSMRRTRLCDEQQSGAVEACWAHNPEVRGSKPCSARTFLLFECEDFSLLRHHPPQLSGRAVGGKQANFETLKRRGVADAKCFGGRSG